MPRPRKLIQDPDAFIPVQQNLFLHPTIAERTNYNPYPQIYRREAEISGVLERSEDLVGLDLEFNKSKPTILGISNDTEAVSVPWSERRAKEIIDFVKYRRKRLVAFSTVGADKFEMERALDVKTPLEMWDDAMISHFFDNNDLTKSPDKDADDEGDQGSQGYMSLGTAITFYTDLPVYKNCRGPACTGQICPRHDVFGYNAVDAWAGVKVHRGALAGMARKKIPYELYREHLELSEICWDMQRQGVLIDRKHVQELDTYLTERKEKLFPSTKKGKKTVYEGPFSPTSSKQIKEYFASHSLILPDTDKKTIEIYLEREARRRGISIGRGADKFAAVEDAVDAGKLNNHVADLFRLHLFKSTGKGANSWFDPKYFDLYGLVHPRFNHCGTSTFRLSSSGPNFQNIPRVGEFGKRIRKAIIPRPGFRIAKADYCLAPETRILTSALEWKRIDSLMIGEKVVGFDEALGPKCSMREATVVSSKTINRPSYRLKIGTKTIVASAEHKWVVRRKRGNSATRVWVETKDLKTGDVLCKFVDPWEEDLSREGGYIAGFLDGEGWVNQRRLGFGQKEGQVLEYVMNVLSDKGFTDIYRHRNKKGVVKCSPNGSRAALRVLGTFRPQRLLKKANSLWEGTRSWSKSSCFETVSNIEYVGEKPVVALGTSTGTLIAEGLLTHNCQLELRQCLYLAGIDPADAGKDAFTWLVQESKGAFEEAAGRYNFKPRDIAKSVSHAGDYLEGFTVLYPEDLERRRIKEEIAAGALLVCWDWEYAGGVVAFTAANLAERLFGSKAPANRKKALEIQELYFSKFPQIRRWQQSVTDFIQDHGYIQSPAGHVLVLYGDPVKNAKVACAFLGQGTSALHVQAIMLRYRRELGVLPLMQVHDELVMEVPIGWDDKHVLYHFELMEEETWRLSGFKSPVKVSAGPSWGEAKEIER